MQAVLLAGSRGTRMGLLTETMPKPMLPVAKTGIQTGIDPGVTLSAGARTAPGEIVTRDR